MVSRIIATVVVFPFLPVEDGSTGARFGAMNIWIRLQVLREDEEDSNGRRMGSGLARG